MQDVRSKLIGYWLRRIPLTMTAQSIATSRNPAFEHAAQSAEMALPESRNEFICKGRVNESLLVGRSFRVQLRFLAITLSVLSNAFSASLRASLVFCFR